MKKLQRLSIVGIKGIPSKYGGFETLVENLVEKFDGFDITVFCERASYLKRPKHYRDNVRLKYLPLRANGIQSILYDICGLLMSIRLYDVVLVLGVSGCIFLPVFKILTPRTRVVVNIDGLEWKRAKWNYLIKLFLKFSERLAVKYSNIVISDNKVINNYIVDEYSKSSILIEYGGDHVQHLSFDANLLNEYPFLDKKYCFTVCRIEPENNLHMILESFSANKICYPLVIVGNWDDNKYGKSLKKKYSDIEGIILLDAIYESSILNVLRSNCYLYIHGHSAGGTNPSLVEAMNLGLVPICFDVGYNRETTGNCTLYFTNSDTLAKNITTLTEFDMVDIRKKMLKIAQDHYSWRDIKQKYYDCLFVVK